MPDILVGKTILIISPQAWGKMFLSKHHYALELAKMGNQVFFLNPPNQNKWLLKSKVDIIESDLNANLKIISHTLFFPFILRFYALPFFHLLMKFHIEVVIRKITEPINIIWSFDQGNNYPFKFFSKSALKIFHPVDEPRTNQAIRAAL